MIPLSDPDDIKTQHDALFRALTAKTRVNADGTHTYVEGKTFDEVASTPRSMLEFLYEGKSARQPVDTKLAAQRLGVTQRTVQRWVRGDSKPRADMLRKLSTRTRQTVTTKRGRAQLARRLRQNVPADRNRIVKIHGTMGPTTDPNNRDYLRSGNASLELTPEQQASVMDAWAENGDEGAIDYLTGLYQTGYVPDWQFHGISGIEWKPSTRGY